MPNWPGWIDGGVLWSLLISLAWAVGLAGFAAWLMRRAEATIADWI
jgi:hypothetical protein